MAANIFKEYGRLKKLTEEALDKVEENSEEEQQLLFQQTLLEEIENYLYSFDWLSHQRSKDKIRVYLASGYDYDVVCTQFDISYKNATDAVKWASRQFRQKVGEETHKLIKEGFLDEARAAFELGTGKINMERYISKEFTKNLPEAKMGVYDLEECVTELKILKSMSKPYMQTLCKKMDKEKMAYLMYLLEGSSKKAIFYRPTLIYMLRGQYSVQDVLDTEPYIKQDMEMF